MPDDYYATIIRQRDATEAAQILADDCRKKDAHIAALRKRVAELEVRLLKAPMEMRGIIEAALVGQVEVNIEHMERLVAANAALKARVAELEAELREYKQRCYVLEA